MLKIAQKHKQDTVQYFLKYSIRSASWHFMVVPFSDNIYSFNLLLYIEVLCNLFENTFSFSVCAAEEETFSFLSGFSEHLFDMQ